MGSIEDERELRFVVGVPYLQSFWQRSLLIGNKRALSYNLRKAITRILQRIPKIRTRQWVL